MLWCHRAGWVVRPLGAAVSNLLRGKVGCGPRRCRLRIEPGGAQLIQPLSSMTPTDFAKALVGPSAILPNRSFCSTISLFVGERRHRCTHTMLIRRYSAEIVELSLSGAPESKSFLPRRDSSMPLCAAVHAAHMRVRLAAQRAVSVAHGSCSRLSVTAVEGKRRYHLVRVRIGQYIAVHATM
jgi:hypothetical protein